MSITSPILATASAPVASGVSGGTSHPSVSPGDNENCLIWMDFTVDQSAAVDQSPNQLGAMTKVSGDLVDHTGVNDSLLGVGLENGADASSRYQTAEPTFTMASGSLLLSVFQYDLNSVAAETENIGIEDNYHRGMSKVSGTAITYVNDITPAATLQILSQDGKHTHGMMTLISAAGVADTLEYIIQPDGVILEQATLAGIWSASYTGVDPLFDLQADTAAANTCTHAAALFGIHNYPRSYAIAAQILRDIVGLWHGGRYHTPVGLTPNGL